MKRGLGIVPSAVFVFWIALLNSSAWAQDEVKIDGKHMREMKGRFGTYGYNPKQTLIQEGTKLHIKLPAGVPNVVQTAIYSRFVLAGECEAFCSYELIDFPPVKTGYGSSVGLAFDASDEGAWGGIQRAFNRAGNCYVIMTVLPSADGKMKEQVKILTTKATKGKLGLKREKGNLIFLAAESLNTELVEVHRFPFTDETLRSVRFFGDPGGSPTALEARLSNITIRADEITSGIPKKEKQGLTWQWPAIGITITLLAGVLVWWMKCGQKLGE